MAHIQRFRDHGYSNLSKPNRNQHLRLNRQHPTQRRQNPPRLSRSLQQSHHLRLRQNRPKLPGKTSRLRRHHRQQPPKPPRQNHRPNPSPSRPPTRPNTHPHNPKPTLLKPLQQPLEPHPNPPDPLPNQQTHHLRHRPPNNPSRHRPTQPIKGQRQTVDYERGYSDIHERNRNTNQPENQLRNVP
jgi:hypothetical protein